MLKSKAEFTPAEIVPEFVILPLFELLKYKVRLLALIVPELLRFVILVPEPVEIIARLPALLITPSLTKLLIVPATPDDSLRIVAYVEEVSLLEECAIVP